MTSTPAGTRVSSRLPDFPWDKLHRRTPRARARTRTASSTSRSARPSTRRPRSSSRRSRGAADSPGYPTTIGLEATRQAAIDWLAPPHGVTGLGLDGVLPVIGSKELIGSMPVHLGIGAGDLIAYPELAYPTYEVGRGAGRRPRGGDRLADLARPRGAAAAVAQLPVQPDRPGAAASSTCARSSTGAASAARSWSPTSATSSARGRPTPVSVLHPDVCGGSHEGILAVHSLSKRSNLAGYRCAFVAGDPGLVGELLAVRKNLGLQMPGPQQRGDGRRARRRRARRRAARAGTPRAGATLRAALERRRLPHRPLRGVALPVGHPRRGLLGHRAGLADLGILVAPGDFYGPAGRAPRAGGLHRHRRADRRRGATASRLRHRGSGRTGPGRPATRRPPPSRPSEHRVQARVGHRGRGDDRAHGRSRHPPRRRHHARGRAGTEGVRRVRAPAGTHGAAPVLVRHPGRLGAPSPGRRLGAAGIGCARPPRRGRGPPGSCSKAEDCRTWTAEMLSIRRTDSTSSSPCRTRPCPSTAVTWPCSHCPVTRTSTLTSRSLGPGEGGADGVDRRGSHAGTLGRGGASVRCRRWHIPTMWGVDQTARSAAAAGIGWAWPSASAAPRPSGAASTWGRPSKAAAWRT